MSHRPCLVVLDPFLADGVQFGDVELHAWFIIAIDQNLAGTHRKFIGCAGSIQKGDPVFLDLGGH